MEGRLVAISDAVRGRRISAVELVERSLGRIDAARELNAVVALRADGALADALALDERVARGDDPGPLAGLPLLVKDIEDAAGLPTTFGSLLHRDAAPAAADGVVADPSRSAWVRWRAAVGLKNASPLWTACTAWRSSAGLVSFRR